MEPAQSFRPFDDVKSQPMTTATVQNSFQSMSLQPDRSDSIQNSFQTMTLQPEKPVTVNNALMQPSFVPLQPTSTNLYHQSSPTQSFTPLNQSPYTFPTSPQPNLFQQYHNTQVLQPQRISAIPKKPTDANLAKDFDPFV
jgi:hypothetical protein